jgi:cell division septation protein DedD
MRHAPRALAGGALAAAALILAACGSSTPGLLSSQQAGVLNAALNGVNRNFNHGHCVKAQTHAEALRRHIAQLPSSVNHRIRTSLGQGARTVEQYVAQDCVQQHAVTPPPIVTTPPPTTTTKTKPNTTPTPPPTTVGTTTNPGATPPPNPGNKGKGHGHGHDHGPPGQGPQGGD